MKTRKLFLATIAMLFHLSVYAAQEYYYAGVSYGDFRFIVWTGAFINKPYAAATFPNYVVEYDPPRDTGIPPYSGDITIPTFMLWNGVKLDVEAIDTYAFNNCVELKSVRIHSGISLINTGGFKGILDDPRENEGNPFAGCSNLESIIVDENNSVFDSRNNCNAVIETKTNTLLSGCKNTLIPDEIKAIGEKAFYNCSGLKSVPILKKVNRIGDQAFEGCTGLSSIEIPSYSHIGYQAFKDCSNIKTITITPSSLGENAFCGCSSIEDVYCNRYVKLQTRVFDESAKNAVLHVRDVDIENFKADEAWSVFKKIVIDEIVTDFTITYYVDGEEYKTEKYKYEDEVTPLEAPVKDGYTFSGWSKIPKIMPGRNVKVNGSFTKNEVNKGGIIYHVFNEKAKVTGSVNVSGDVEIASIVTFNDKTVPVTDILESSFLYNSNITSVVIPENVKNIGKNAFFKCKNLVSIEFGRNLSHIDMRAFANIDKLTDITIYAEEAPDADRTAFENSYTDYITLHVPGGSVNKYKETAPWKNFKEIVAIEGTEVVQKYKLTYMVDGEAYKTFDVHEGESITPEAEPTKEGYVFSGWSWIPSKMPAEDVVVSGTFKQVGYNVSDNIYVIEGNEATFATTNITSGDLAISPTIVVNNTVYNVTAVAEYSCMNKTGITSVTIPNNVAVIGDNAFYGCTGVNSISIGESLRYIGSNAFSYIGTSASARKRAPSEPLIIECYAENVPDAQNDSFDRIDMDNTILKVKDSLVDSYKSVYPWSQFKNITGFNAPTGINSVQSERNDCLIFTTGGHKTDNLRKGINIIQSKQGVKKVIVK